MIDHPSVEVVYYHSFPTRSRESIENEILILDIMLDKLHHADFANTDDIIYEDVLEYLTKVREELIDTLYPPYHLIPKGHFQNHDREKRKQAEREEFAVRDERYYNRYHAYDWEKYEDRE